MLGISIRVDRLTRSIEDANTGERYETTLLQVLPEQAQTIKKSHWLFDWHWEIKQPERNIYKLVKVVEPSVVQGLVSLESRGDHVFLHLIENAKINRGSSKKYVGVAGNLFAHACKCSFELGFGGFVAFDSKTKLISHYIKTLEATHVGAQRLHLDEKVAKKLIIRYFGGYEAE